MSPAQRPNILILMTDQQRADALGSVSRWVQTPNIDRLAALGVQFLNTYTTSPQCIPARVSLMLGNYSHNHGVWANKKYVIPSDSDTWVRRLQAGGYHTAVFGKTHLFIHQGNLRQGEQTLHDIGFDIAEEVAGPRAATVSSSRLTDLWQEAGVRRAYNEDMRDRYQNKPWVVRPTPLPFDLYPDVYIARRAIEHLKEYDGDRPWLCWVGFTGPHEPWDTPAEYADRYRPQDMPKPVALTDAPAARSSVDLDGGGEYDLDTDPDDDGSGPRGALYKRLRRRFPLTPDDVAAMRANYAGHITLIDEKVGEVLTAVEARGELDNTIVVFTSDHGEQNGDHGLIYKQNFLGPSVRVPLILRVPAWVAPVKSGKTVKSPVELLDIGATLLELTGTNDRKFGFSRSLAPVLARPRSHHRRAALSEYGHEIMLATEEWKLAVNRAGRPYLLFDLDSDPQETVNLVGRAKTADQERFLTELLLRRLVQTLS